GRKRINNYFNLRWVEIVKAALSDAQQEMLAESQFRQLMLMGTHTFSVMFAHQILSRQLVTRKLYELWWLFAGKPIRYGIADFELKDEYKDDDSRLRLGLLLLVEGILCPTSGSTQIRPEVVEMLSDIPILGEPDSWRKTPLQYKVLHTLWFYVKINVVTVQNLELIGQSASVRSILCDGSDIPPFPDEVEDMAVAHMVSLIRDGFPFEINTWQGGGVLRQLIQNNGRVVMEQTV
ncbi:unnamed protein product, partial [Brassica rapa subsp. narinosa]